MEEKKKQPKSLPGMNIEWYESLKTDEDWLEYRTLELMDAGFSEEEKTINYYILFYKIPSAKACHK